ncbi:hypothetical protein BC835DRAFT_1334543, partial [Cytidiella melzeri]
MLSVAVVSRLICYVTVHAHLSRRKMDSDGNSEEQGELFVDETPGELPTAGMFWGLMAVSSGMLCSPEDLGAA